jgi:hypothetical protein
MFQACVSLYLKLFWLIRRCCNVAIVFYIGWLCTICLLLDERISIKPCIFVCG